MVKDDRHRTRALVTPEGREIGIVGNQAVFSLIGQIQEETHRFAITYHHESHGKSALRSALDGIPGVGPKRREELRKKFGTIKGGGGEPDGGPGGGGAKTRPGQFGGIFIQEGEAIKKRPAALTRGKRGLIIKAEGIPLQDGQPSLLNLES